MLWRGAQYEAAQALGSTVELAQLAVAHDQPGELLYLLGRVESEGDRRALFDLHRQWGEGLAARAARRPVARPPRPAERGAIRVGFLSGDLRHHVVAWFVEPLFSHRAEGFELYVYSPHRAPADPVRPWFAQRAAAYRDLPDDDREAASVIAADQLDLLIDLGGVTAGNRPGVMAYRPAPLQASWLGYPHSLGLPTVDLLFADRWTAPPDPTRLLERPALFERSWICMAPAAFGADPPPADTAPAARNGVVTFGTMNDPYKIGPPALAAWARVLAEVPGSRFLIVRPEAGAPCFQEAVAHRFADAGVAADRLDFRPVRGAVRPLYGGIDIALDTFPVTGGTTTCEALWMGVPTVTLVGPGLSERLSAAILHHAGLGGLVAETVDAYVALAVRLAGAPDQLTALRREIRGRIRSRPFGDPLAFAADFYGLVRDVVAARPAG